MVDIVISIVATIILTSGVCIYIYDKKMKRMQKQFEEGEKCVNTAPFFD